MQYSDTRSFAAYTLRTCLKLQCSSLLQVLKVISRTNIKTVNCQLSNQRYNLNAVLETEVQICFNFPVKCTKFQAGQIAKLQSVLLRVVTVTSGLCAQDCD
jgi:hypothetical protein